MVVFLLRGGYDGLALTRCMLIFSEKINGRVASARLMMMALALEFRICVARCDGRKFSD